MIPRGLTDKHFLRAAEIIRNQGVPNSRKSVHYDLLLNDVKYPPKYVVSIATRLLTGKEHPSNAFNAVEAKNYFLSRGYKVFDRRVSKVRVIADENDESAFPEGTAKFSLHRRHERDSSISRLAKAIRQEKTGKLECDVCKIYFALKYGSHGDGFIEAHHTKPVSTLDGKTKTSVKDLALVCSNCHRMLHRGPTLLSVEDLKALVRGQAVT